MEGDFPWAKQELVFPVVLDHLAIVLHFIIQN